MNSIGERLRQERLRQGFDLSQISDLTKISFVMLEAIEADDLESLPGSFFTRSFVRQYAQALGLDEVEFEPELRRRAGFGHPAADQPENALPHLVAGPVPVRAARRAPKRHWLGSLVTFVLILAACSAGYKWQKTRANSAKPPAISVAGRTPSPAPPAATPKAVPAATPANSPAARPPAAAAVATPAVEPFIEAAAAPPPEPATGTAAIRLEVRAASEAWVRVISGGRLLWSGVLQPNEARVFEGADSMTLRAGNAGALAVTFNGRPLGELGPQGQVRTIEFTPSGFKFVTPAPATPAPPPEEP